MLNKTFPSRLSKLSSKKKDDSVILEFILTHTSDQQLQDFLSSLDITYNLSLQHSFTSNTINWKKIHFDINVALLKITFDSLTMTADLIGISVSVKNKKNSSIFKYDLIFNKQHDPNIDSTFAITFLNRKEEDEDGKKTFLEYDTTIKNK